MKQNKKILCQVKKKKKRRFFKYLSFILFGVIGLFIAEEICLSSNSLFPGTKMKLDAGMEQSPGYSILLVIFFYRNNNNISNLYQQIFYFFIFYCRMKILSPTYYLIDFHFVTIKSWSWSYIFLKSQIQPFNQGMENWLWCLKIS